MQDLVGRARSQLMAIEQVHGIRILNREEVASIIGSGAADHRQVLWICTSLNSWVAISGCRGEVSIPLDVINGLLCRYRT